MVGLNPWQLKTGFKAIFSLTIADYLQETRMQKARLLLEETDLPIARIADIVGYTHPFAFSSAFRKYYGYAPSLVRKGRRTRKD
jgi:AraC-like DNA-binding protein